MTANKRKAAGAAAAIALLGAALVAVQHGGLPSLPNSGTQDATAAATRAAAQPGKPGTAPGLHKLGDKPQWQALSPAQQLALQPLQAEWNQIDGPRKQKWLQLANRFGALKPEEQQRLHERMRAWARLTPAQRDLARETYTRTRKIGQEQKTASWESYQQLPDEQKQKLAASSATRKASTVVSTQAGGKVVAPLGQGATSCPPGMIRNTVSVTPPCVALPLPAAPLPAPQNPAAPNPAQPVPPANPPQPEKPVPANWGISPNNA